MKPISENPRLAQLNSVWKGLPSQPMNRANTRPKIVWARKFTKYAIAIEENRDQANSSSTTVAAASGRGQLQSLIAPAIGLRTRKVRGEFNSRKRISDPMGTFFRPGALTRPACGPGRRTATAAARRSGGGRRPGTAAARRRSPRLPAGSTQRHAAAAPRASGAKPRPRSP